MDILKMMETDHKGAMKLIRKLEARAEKPGRETSALTEELIFEVTLHAKSEEKALYTMCQKKNKELRDFSLEGYLEHSLIDEMLHTLGKAQPGKSGEFKAALSVVKELLEHHATEEEEKEMFPKLRKAFSAEEREEMGEMMMKFKAQLRARVEKQAAKAAA